MHHREIDPNCGLPKAQPQRGPVVQAARLLLRVYQVTLSALVGRECRHLPTCSEYMDEAIVRHGLWPGLWMGTARICRCNPWGTHGLDFVPGDLPQGAAWYRPWRYGRWRGTLPVPPPRCEAVGPGDGDRSS
ncbi:membrane protein insertion efficiency factor YidD [Alsobacter sp. R-9]